MLRIPRFLPFLGFKSKANKVKKSQRIWFEHKYVHNLNELNWPSVLLPSVEKKIEFWINEWMSCHKVPLGCQMISALDGNFGLFKSPSKRLLFKTQMSHFNAHWGRQREFLKSSDSCKCHMDKGLLSFYLRGWLFYYGDICTISV